MNAKEAFWFDDITELYKNNNYKKIFVNNTMSFNEIFNAVTRLIILLALILLLFFPSVGICLLLVLMMALLVIMYYAIIPVLDTKPTTVERMQNVSNIRSRQRPNIKFPLRSSNTPSNNTHCLIKNIYDGSFTSGQNSQSLSSANLASLYNQTNMSQLSNISDLPSMTNVSDIPNLKHLPYPTNISSVPIISNIPTIKQVVGSNESTDEINQDFNDVDMRNFHENLFDTVDNLYEKTNYTRQFESVPNHLAPDNQGEARKWIYNTPVTCKEKSTQCLKFTDLQKIRTRVL